MSLKQGRPSEGKTGPDQRHVTRLESDEEIRQALQARRSQAKGQAKAVLPGTQVPAPAAGAGEIEVQAERPVERPPIALLCVLDDGELDGEWLRLRNERTVIGRTDGDIRIPHDGLISGRHAEILRQPGPNGYHWLLVDLQSTNGTFVRIRNTPLRHENELLIGTGRYRFEAGLAAGQADPAPERRSPAPTTRTWLNEPVRSLLPALVEMTPAGPVQRIPLTLPEYWIGRDAQDCPIARPGDVLVSARHARLYRDAKGQWHIENNKSLNGLWLRVLESIALGKACRFRLGEQQFIFRVK